MVCKGLRRCQCTKSLHSALSLFVLDSPIPHITYRLTENELLKFRQILTVNESDRPIGITCILSLFIPIPQSIYTVPNFTVPFFEDFYSSQCKYFLFTNGVLILFDPALFVGRICYYDIILYRVYSTFEIGRWTAEMQWRTISNG